jgi:hypothetical protein
MGNLCQEGNFRHLLILGGGVGEIVFRLGEVARHWLQQRKVKFKKVMYLQKLCKIMVVVNTFHKCKILQFVKRVHNW